VVQQELIEFHAATRSPINKLLTDEEYRLRLKLIGEEWTEFCQEAAGLDLAAPSEGFAKEMADLMYVLAGTAVAMGINIEEVFRRVHVSNMSKMNPVTGRPDYRKDGKVLKGDRYRPPNITDCMPNYTNVVPISPCVGHAFTPDQQEMGFDTP